MSITLIIFDLDGTLVDSSVDITDAINCALESHGMGRITVRTAISLIGEGVTRLIEKLVERDPAGRGTVSKEQLLARFLDHYSVHLTDHTTVYQGVRETLERLSAYRKAVISNKREDLSVSVLKNLDLWRYMDLVVGSDTTSERKPSPIPILYVLDKFGVGKGDALVVGDSNFDVEAGRAAGVRTVGVTYGYRSVDFLKDADFIINKMEELVAVVEGLSVATR
ncbi:MAG TPA: HAD-IA family hydrolase [Dissulfurispiraceae bacterium]|nr:HAD-IA family hydrolase [Dissulfurispiraceae bacterium]